MCAGGPGLIPGVDQHDSGSIALRYQLVSLCSWVTATEDCVAELKRAAVRWSDAAHTARGAHYSRDSLAVSTGTLEVGNMRPI